jgi:hypothetical protein
MLNRRRRCESMSTNTPNLGLYQFIFRSKPMLEADLNFQKKLFDLGYFKIFKKSMDFMKESMDFWLAI